MNYFLMVDLLSPFWGFFVYQNGLKIRENLEVIDKVSTVM